MLKNNVCKFTPSSLIKDREIINFIYEKNPEAMKMKKAIETNRICLIVRGNVSFNYNNRTVRCTAGDILFLFENEVCYACPDGDTEYMYISFKGTRYDELFRRFSISHDRRHFSGFDGLIPLWSESLTRAIDDNIDLIAESMLLYAFGRFSGEVSESTDIINRIIDFTEKNFTSTELSLATLSEELNYNPKYISHLFKKRMGMGYTEYLRMIRLKNAIALFDHGLDSIKNVALLSGFSDPLYFSSVFKANIGRSPKEYIAGRRIAELAGNDNATDRNDGNDGSIGNDGKGGNDGNDGNTANENNVSEPQSI